MIVSKTTAEALLGKELKSAWPKGSRKTSYYLLSSTGERNLGGPYKNREKALERERQVQYFKRRSNPEDFHSRSHDWGQIVTLDGDSRGEILDHYLKKGRYMLPYLKGHDVIVVLGLGGDNFVYRRKNPDGSRIRISQLRGDTPKSLEYWILRRGIEFHPVIGKTTDRVWIDVDVHASKGNLSKAKRMVRREIPYLESLLRGLYRGKIKAYASGNDGGVHIEMMLPSRVNTDKARRQILEALKSEYSDDELFTTRPCGSRRMCVRLDVTTLKNTGSVKAPYSFSKKGGYKRPL